MRIFEKIETIRRLIGAEPPSKGWLPSDHNPPPSSSPDRLIAIGASAGGPAALARILTCLPSKFSAAVVVVQHVDAQFAQGLANWLDDQTPLRVRLAQEGDLPTPGTILLPGRDQHLVFANARRLTYTQEPSNCS